jgi:hypothetical protein
MNKNTNTSVNTNIDISFIVDVNLRNSLEYTIVVNNTNSWDTVKTYKNIEYNIDLFHLHKLDIITVNRTHRFGFHHTPKS